MKKPMKVYLHLVEPEKYPDFEQRAAKAITRSALNNRIQFSSLRGFPTTDESIKVVEALADMGARANPSEGSSLIEIQETIDMYVKHFKLGKVLWPVYPTLLARNFKQLVDICAEQGLYLYDFWGFVPGSKASAKSIWGEYKIPEDVDQYLRETLGDHFFGYDNGEQDGRYIHALARQTAPLLASRQQQYRNFQAYFEKLNDAMLNHTVTLASLTFLHYFAREGNTIMIGAETAQALPGSIMWFQFIRGAAKQYGLLYYGNASVWNRWGYKDYLIDNKKADTSQGFEMGRYAGTSLSLLRRLIYNHYMYNCDILGFEGSWLVAHKAGEGETHTDSTYIINGKRYELTPVGVVQQKCGEFVAQHQRPGTLYTPLAILADFHAGWVPPRHLYTSDIYKVWGNIPYGPGDYQLHRLISMLSPGYEDAGFYRDERGFLTPTPYGEIADILLSDVRQAVLNRYGMVLVTCDTSLTFELFDKCKAFVAGGGHLVIFAGTVLRHLCLLDYDASYLSFFGLSALSGAESWSGQASLTGGQEMAVEDLAVCPATPAQGATVAAWGSDRRPLILESQSGSGKVSLILAENGLQRTGDAYSQDNRPNEPICQPYELSDLVRGYLAGLFDNLRLVAVDNRVLQYCVDIKNEREYTLFVANNTLNTEAYRIICPVGTIREVIPLPIFDQVEHLDEFLPLGFADGHCPVQAEGDYTIQPGDCRLYTVITESLPFEPVGESLPAPRDEQLYLALGYQRKSIKDFILDQPTLQHHFAGLLVPAEYFDRLDKEVAGKEAHYLNLQKISIYVDFTRMINHYPDLSLIGNLDYRYAEAMRKIEQILDKASVYTCRGALFTAQRNAENEYTAEQARNGLIHAAKMIGQLCAARGIGFILQNRPTFIRADEIRAFAADQPQIKLAVNTANALCEGFDFHSAVGQADLLMLSAPAADAFHQLYPMNKPIRGSAWADQLKNACRLARDRGIPVMLCAEYQDWDDVMADLAVL